MSKRLSRTNYLRANKWRSRLPKGMNGTSVFLKDIKNVKNAFFSVDDLIEMFSKQTNSQENLRDIYRERLSANLKSKRLTERFLSNIEIYLDDCNRKNRRISINDYMTLGFYIL